jgi:Homeodomain-like domain
LRGKHPEHKLAQLVLMPERRPRNERLTGDVDDHPDPRDRLDERLDAIALIDQLRALPRRRRAVALLEAAGYSDAETAALLGCSRRTVVGELTALRLRISTDGASSAPCAGGPESVGVENPLRTSGGPATFFTEGHFLRGSMVLAVNTEEGLRAALESGEMTRCLRDPLTQCVLPGRDHPDGAVYVVVRPGHFEDEDGVSSLFPGDVLTASEARHAGSALRRLVLDGIVVELPSKRGVFLLWTAARDRARRAERALGWFVASEAA